MRQNMNARITKLGALGATVGLALALVAGSAAMAAPHSNGGKKPAPSPTPTSSYSCATFSGLKLTQSSVSYSGVMLSSGQVVTANVASYATGSNIFLSTSNGLSLAFYSAPASTGLAFRAPATGVYSLGWSLQSATGTTVTSASSWSFTCS
jgi:hypothetical protein